MYNSRSKTDNNFSTESTSVGGDAATDTMRDKNRYTTMRNEFYLRRFLGQSAGYLRILEQNTRS